MATADLTVLALGRPGASKVQSVQRRLDEVEPHETLRALFSPAPARMLIAVAASSPLRLPLLTLVAIAALLALAVPAVAQTSADPGTTAVQQDGVEPPESSAGPGTVITDPADETEPAEEDDPAEPQAASGDDDAEDPPPTQTKRGELHVLGTTASSKPAAVTAQPHTSAAATPDTLPFTGINAGVLALLGAALLAAGVIVRRSVSV
jgi:hypothetical protein